VLFFFGPLGFFVLMSDSVVAGSVPPLPVAPSSVTSVGAVHPEMNATEKATLAAARRAAE
jgi:hypothetical protein